jgi:hypothetical protein
MTLSTLSLTLFLHGSITGAFLISSFFAVCCCLWDLLSAYSPTYNFPPLSPTCGGPSGVLLLLVLFLLPFSGSASVFLFSFSVVPSDPPPTLFPRRACFAPLFDSLRCALCLFFNVFFRRFQHGGATLAPFPFYPQRDDSVDIDWEWRWSRFPFKSYLKLCTLPLAFCRCHDSRRNTRGS